MKKVITRATPGRSLVWNIFERILSQLTRLPLFMPVLAMNPPFRQGVFHTLLFFYDMIWSPCLTYKYNLVRFNGIYNWIITHLYCPHPLMCPAWAFPYRPNLKTVSQYQRHSPDEICRQLWSENMKNDWKENFQKYYIMESAANTVNSTFLTGGTPVPRESNTSNSNDSSLPSMAMLNSAISVRMSRLGLLAMIPPST